MLYKDEFTMKIFLLIIANSYIIHFIDIFFISL